MYSTKCITIFIVNRAYNNKRRGDQEKPRSTHKGSDRDPDIEIWNWSFFQRPIMPEKQWTKFPIGPKFIHLSQSPLPCSQTTNFLKSHSSKNTTSVCNGSTWLILLKQRAETKDFIGQHLPYVPKQKYTKILICIHFFLHSLKSSWSASMSSPSIFTQSGNYSRMHWTDTMWMSCTVRCASYLVCVCIYYIKSLLVSLWCHSTQ